MLWGAVGPVARLPAWWLLVASRPPWEEAGRGAGPRCPFTVARLCPGGGTVIRVHGISLFKAAKGLSERRKLRKEPSAPAQEARAPSRGPTS